MFSLFRSFHQTICSSANYTLICHLLSKSSITPNGSVNNLGAIFFQRINMYEHVTSVCRAVYYHLKNIHCLKAILTQETLLTVVIVFVISRIDYCNSLLYGISDYNINRLQRIQKSAAHLVTNTRKYDHITLILYKLLCLPVRQHIHFNILLITYKSINDMASEYLNWCPLESHPENSDHPVRYYCRCQCLGSSHTVIVRLVLQPLFCGIGWRQIL